MNENQALSAFKQTSARDIAQRIRTLRKSRGWTLREIEKLSQGQIKAVVMGAYERNSRSLSLPRAIAIANLFAIPLEDLIGTRQCAPAQNQSKLTFDQRQIRSVSSENYKIERATLDRYLQAIAARRRDWNGEILTLRATDFDTLTLLLSMGENELEQWLKSNKFLLTRNS